MYGEWGAGRSTPRPSEKALVGSAFIQGEKEDLKTEQREIAGVLVVHRKRPCLSDLLLLTPTGSLHAIPIRYRNLVSFRKHLGVSHLGATSEAEHPAVVL